MLGSFDDGHRRRRRRGFGLGFQLFYTLQKQVYLLFQKSSLTGLARVRRERMDGEYRRDWPLSFSIRGGWERRKGGLLERRENILHELFDAPAFITRALEASFACGRSEGDWLFLAAGWTKKGLSQELESRFGLNTKPILMI
jgi:hypothetical protein